MEEIVWIETPGCSKCRPDASYRRRRSCIGCDKLMVRPKKVRRFRIKAAVTPAAQRDERDRNVFLFRSQGMSYGRIATELKLPRSTVQSILSKKNTAVTGKTEAG